MARSKTLLLIDGNSLFHRAYHAIPFLTDKSGEVANAVFGFSNMLLKALNEVKPDFIACAFDTAAPTFRHIEFEKYKAQRVAPPPDLYPQLPKVKKALDAFGIKYFDKEGYEADDLLATLASKAISHLPLAIRETKDERQKAIDVIILSSDRDVLQLVDGSIKVQMPSFAASAVQASKDKKATEGKPGWGELVGAKEVKEKFGLEPHQMVDYKSLTGDSSDNVPGISGIGPKTASALLQKYHTLENLFKHLGEIDDKLRTKLATGKEIALAAKKLVELDRNVAISFELLELSFKPDWERVRREYEELGFKSIVAKLTGGSAPQKDEKIVNSEPKTNSQDQLELI